MLRKIPQIVLTIIYVLAEAVLTFSLFLGFGLRDKGNDPVGDFWLPGIPYFIAYILILVGIISVWRIRKGSRLIAKFAAYFPLAVIIGGLLYIFVFVRVLHP